MALARLLWRADLDTGKFTAGTQRMAKGTDDVGTSVANVGQRMAGWVAAGGAALAVITQISDALDMAADRAERLERSLDLAQGGATAGGRELRDQLLGLEFTPEIATSAAATVIGRTPFEMGSQEQAAAANTAAQYERAGGDSNELFRLAHAFGISDDVNAIGDLANLAFAGAGAQNAGLNEVVTGALSLAPSASQMGLSARETLQLSLDAEKAGFSPSALNLPLQSALTRQAEGGGPARDHLLDIEEQIRNADTEEEALAIAAPVYGSRGALLIVRGIRGGGFGFGDEALSDAHLEGALGLGAIEATTEERREAASADDNALSGLIRNVVPDTVERNMIRLQDSWGGGPRQSNEVVVIIQDSTRRGVEASQATVDDERDGRTAGTVGTQPPPR